MGGFAPGGAPPSISQLKKQKEGGESPAQGKRKYYLLLYYQIALLHQMKLLQKHQRKLQIMLHRKVTFILE